MFKILLLNCILIGLLPLLSGCNPKNKVVDSTSQTISTCFAKKLDIHTLDSIEQLKGGASGAQLFKVSANGKNYVVRIVKNRSLQELQNEFTCQEIASTQGYGPKVYVTDLDQGIIVMDFLERQPMTPELKNSEKCYTALGTFLRIMHTGPSFPATSYNTYTAIDDVLKKLQGKGQSSITIQRIQNIVGNIQDAAQRFSHVAPCHNDLNPENLFYVNDKVFAIDFESARQDDPYFDLATVSIYNREHEDILLNAYFQHPMTEKEKAKFYLVKQLAFIFIALQYIRQETLSTDVLDPDKITLAQPLADIIADITQGTISVDAGHTQERLMLAQSILKEVFGNSESQAFKNAVECLTK